MPLHMFELTMKKKPLALLVIQEWPAAYHVNLWKAWGKKKKPEPEFNAIEIVLQTHCKMTMTGAPVGKPEMTAEQFKQWLLKTYDVDHDGKISREELAKAISAAGGWFPGWKSKLGMRRADQNHNGYIDHSELDDNNFKRFAEKHLGVKIY